MKSSDMRTLTIGIRRPNRRSPRRAPRRGILLLVVLSLLVLFVLAGLTFMVVAGQYRRSTLLASQQERTGDLPKLQLETAMYELLRDTTNPFSGLAGQSLLADKYGQQAIPLRVIQAYSSRDNATDLSAAPLSILSVDTNDVHALDVSPLTAASLGFAADILVGRELTVMTGDSRGGASRIVRYAPGEGVGGSDRICVLPFDSKAGFDLPIVGDGLLLSAAPFDGLGAGFNPLSGARDVSITFPGGSFPSVPAGHFLNSRFLRTTAGGLGLDPSVLLNSGGVDESWDAADADNAYMSCGLSFDAFVNPTSDPLNPRRIRAFPSFHRPDLVNYWGNIFDTAADPGGDLDSLITANPQYRGLDHPEFGWVANAGALSPERQYQRNVLRAIIPRPLAFDHRNFTGSNPGIDQLSVTHPGLRFDPINGPWDVDNDGDGEFDSVWIDLGFPVQSTPSGRSYKPLFAFLVRDMDGHVNLNYAGGVAQKDPNWFDPATMTPLNSNFVVDPATGTTQTAFLPRGQGYGPAEINVAAVLGPTGATAAITDSLVFLGRYGPDDQAGVAAAGDFRFIIGNPTLINYGGLSDFHSAPDIHGRNATFLNYEGSPQTMIAPAALVAGSVNEAIDSPYEIDRYRGDPLFTDAELEQVLRGVDYDRVMYVSSRPEWRQLFSLGPSLAATITTRSYSIPALPRPGYFGIPPGGTAAIWNYPESIRAQFEQRLLAGTGAAATPIQIEAMLPFEFWRGEKMDVNRPWGNGLDDDGSGLADDRLDDAMGEEVYSAVTAGTALPGTKDIQLPGRYDHQRSQLIPPVATGRSVAARLIFARHLYCLAMFLLDDDYTFPVANTALTPDQRREITARRIAQWAVNVVDFRDADLTMTGFEFDLNPLNGWSVDGDLSTDDGMERRVVWGCEAPVLVLTESWAFHDRRVADTPVGNLRDADNAPPPSGNGVPDDLTLDQVRIPQGSLFLELFCPRSVEQLTTRTLDIFNAAGQVDLDKMAPASAGGGDRMPVWRILISRTVVDILSQPAAAAVGYVDPSMRETDFTRVDTMNFNPRDPYLPVVPTEVDEIERIVWFTRDTDINPATMVFPPAINPPPRPEIIANTYYNRTPVGVPSDVSVGQYAVVLPRPITYIGEETSPRELADQRIVLDTSVNPIILRTEGVHGTVGAPDIRRISNNIVPFVAKANEPTTGGWSTLVGTPPANYELGIGLNVSEPIVGPNYYDPPNGDFPTSGTPAVYDAYSPALGLPADNAQGAAAVPPVRLGDYGVAGNVNQALLTGLYGGGTIPELNLRRTAYLQRLADPNAAWDPASNPYITVDWIPIDLTVFNGSSRQTKMTRFTATEEFLDPNDSNLIPATLDPSTDPTWQPAAYFSSRVRGELSSGISPNNLWTTRWTSALDRSPESSVPGPKPGGHEQACQEQFKYALNADFGSFNGSFTPLVPLTVTSGARPFPWMTWNNRPFVSALELMQVPCSGPDRLTFDYTLANFAAAASTPPQSIYNTYAQSADPTSTGVPPTAGVDFPARANGFGHLLNFFNSTNEPLGATPKGPANLARIFDFLHVPSRYVETQHHFLQSTTIAGTPQQQGFDLFWSPFNHLSKMRDPGKINLNTVFDQRVFNALMSGFPEHVDLIESPAVLGKYDEFVRSRQGYTSGSVPPATVGYALDKGYPSVFMQPYRAATTSRLNPVTPTLTPTLQGAESTLLRSSSTTPLVPLFGSTASDTYNASARSPYFAFAGFQRLANLTTTQSNVFGVWITMGYFEVEPNPSGIDAAHPDGLMLGRELGESTGDIQRHRGFYLIDRSIPVAFEPGQNHNVDKAVILRRLIE